MAYTRRTIYAVAAGGLLAGVLAVLVVRRRRRTALGGADPRIDVVNPGWYYRIRDVNDPPPIKTIVQRWACKGEKAYDAPFSDDPKKKQFGVFWYDINEVLPYREYRWTRQTARNGPELWDELKASMEAQEWSRSPEHQARFGPGIDPAHITVGENACAKLSEGNHRIAVAKELGIDRVPVRFHFWKEVRPFSHPDARAKCFSKATLCADESTT